MVYVPGRSYAPTSPVGEFCSTSSCEPFRATPRAPSAAGAFVTESRTVTLSPATACMVQTTPGGGVAAEGCPGAHPNTAPAIAPPNHRDFIRRLLPVWGSPDRVLLPVRHR